MSFYIGFIIKIDYTFSTTEPAGGAKSVRNTLSFLKPYKLHIVIAYFLTFIELIIELILPLLLGKMINSGVINQSIDEVVRWGIIILVLAIVSFSSGVFNSFYASHTSNHFAYDIRNELFQRIQSFSYSMINRFPSSLLVTYFTNDVRQVQNTIFMGLRIMTRAPLMIIGGVIMAFLVNIQLAAIFIIVVPVVLFLINWVLRKAVSLFKEVQQKVDWVNSIIQENLVNMRLIKAFMRRDLEEEKFNQANEQLAIHTRRTFRFVDGSMPILLLLMNLTIVFILWFGHTRAAAGDVIVGDVVAVVNYALRIAMSISMLRFIMMNFSRMQASATRLSSVLRHDYQVEENRSSDRIEQGSLCFENVSFTYPEAKKAALSDISFILESGETLAIIGATGAGKTTLFQLLPRLYEPNTGEIYIDNKTITAYGVKHLREQIGYVSQSPLLFSGSVADNIAWGKKDATKEEIIEAAKTAQIHEVITKLPYGYDTQVNQRGVNLSGGQKQRLSIARALIKKPKILLLDDCTSALDYTTEANLLTEIAQYNCTTLIITQKVTTAKNTDRILLLDSGKVLNFGTHQQLIEKSLLYRKIVQSQREKEDYNVH